MHAWKSTHIQPSLRWETSMFHLFFPRVNSPCTGRGYLRSVASRKWNSALDGMRKARTIREYKPFIDFRW